MWILVSHLIVNGILQYYLKKLMRMLLFDQIILLKSYFFGKNINNYLRKYTTNKKAFSSEFYNEKEVIKFYTQGFFIGDEEVQEHIAKAIKRFKKSK